jgi:predicted dehydrogenase
VDDGRTMSGEDPETIEMPIVDQYTVQGDLFSAAVLENGPVAYPLEDSEANMRAIEAVFRSEQTGGWVTV